MIILDIVEIEGGSQKKTNLPLNKDLLYLGRVKRENVFPLPSCAGSWVSKIHCTIWRESNKWYICDGELGGKKSSNGIFLNGDRVYESVLLEPGQVFILMAPPPCEIQLQVSADLAALEDTLTPALERWCAEGPKLEVIEEMRSAIAQLNHTLAENRALDERLRSEVGAATIARERNEKALAEAFQAFQRMNQAATERHLWLESRTKILTRAVSGVALGLAIALLMISANANGHRREASLEIVIEILLVMAGGGGLAAANGMGKSNDEDLDQWELSR